MKQWQAYKTRCRSVAVSLLGWLLVATMSCQGGRNIRSTEDTSTESVVQDPQQPGKIYVLLIGINRYKNPGIYPLDYTDRDVWALRSSLIRYAKVPAGHIQVLLNEQARRTDIVRALDLLKTRVSKEDTVLLYFSGHGVWMKDTDMSYLAPHDMNQSDVPGTALDHDTLNAKLHNLQAQQIVILLDACHSGYSVKGVRFTPTGTFSASSFKGKGRVVIASSRLSQGSLEDDKKKHGVFTVALLEALSGKADSNGDGRVTMLEACDYVQERTHWLSAALIKRRADLKKHGISPQKPVCKIDVSGRIYLSYPGRSKARLKVVTSPPGATVRIGGYHVGTTPYEADQEPGDKSVEVQLSGHKVWRERIQLQPRQTRTLQVALEKEAGPPASPPPAPVVERPAAEPPSPRPAQPQPSVDSSQSRRPRRAGTIGKVKGMPGAQVVYIPPGTFWMGSPDTESGRDDDEARHRVKLTNGFWMWRTETTQGQFKTLLGYNPSHFGSCGDNCPVEQVNFHEAMAFANAVSAKEGRKADQCYECTGKKEGVTCKLKAAYKGDNGKGYYKCPGWRLPTEAEWEYSARAGTETPFYTGRCLSTKQANYNGNHPLEGCPKGEYRNETIEVGQLGHNPWRLYDMLGNVEEWTWDVQGTYPSDSISVDPVNAQSHLDDALSNGSDRVVRGGSWNYDARRARAAYRYGWGPRIRYRNLGFRVVRVDLPVDR